MKEKTIQEKEWEKIIDYAVENKFKESEKHFKRAMWKRDYQIEKMEKKIKMLKETLKIHKKHIKQLLDKNESPFPPLTIPPIPRTAKNPPK